MNKLETLKDIRALIIELDQVIDETLPKKEDIEVNIGLKLLLRDLFEVYKDE